MSSTTTASCPSFTPNFTTFASSTFTDIGKINCSASSGYEPFSMSVDRDANAWVEYVYEDPIDGSDDGMPNLLFKVSTADASCMSTAFVGGQTGFGEFGMGFVNDPASMTDTLYIAGSSSVSATAKSTLGTLDLTLFKATAVAGAATIAGNPELTGTGTGQLWAFVPPAGSKKSPTPALVTQINTTTGAESNTITLSTITGQAASWAFAYYGGDFFVFLGKEDMNSLSGSDPTVVYHVTSAGVQGTLDTSTTATPRNIVGAGVSTCAPTVPPPPAS